MTMAERIRTLRKERKMTQEELGKHLGIGRSAVLKYENGEVTNIPPDKIQKMCDLFGVSLSYLMCWDNYNEDSLSDELKLIEKIQARWGKDTVEGLSKFLILNDAGKEHILNLLDDVSSMPKYQKEVQGGSR